jgi:hypothetical protein
MGKNANSNNQLRRTTTRNAMATSLPTLSATRRRTSEPWLARGLKITGDRGGVAGDVPCVAAQEGPAAAGEDVVESCLPTSSGPSRPQDGQVYSGGVVCAGSRPGCQVAVDRVRTGTLLTVPQRAQRM